METISFISIITIAFLGSFGHCVGMCGGMVFAYTATKVDGKWDKKRQSSSHLLYCFGRVTTYTILGAFFGALGSVSSFSYFANGILLLIAGFLMVVVGLSLNNKFKFLRLLEHSFSQKVWYQKSFKRILSSKNYFSFYFLGALNGLLPCGFVYVFAITAASTASIFWGAIVMFIFGLSTIPAMFSLGFFIGVFKQVVLRDLFISLASILVIFFGTYTMYKGYKYIQKTYQISLKEKALVKRD